MENTFLGFFKIGLISFVTPISSFVLMHQSYFSLCKFRVLLRFSQIWHGKFVYHCCWSRSIHVICVRCILSPLTFWLTFFKIEELRTEWVAGIDADLLPICKRIAFKITFKYQSKILNYSRSWSTIILVIFSDTSNSTACLCPSRSCTKSLSYCCFKNRGCYWKLFFYRRGF